MENRSQGAADVVPPRPVPFLPPNPQNLTADDVERMIDSRIQLAFAAQQEQDAKRAVFNRKQETYRAIGYGIGGAVLGTGVTLGVTALVRRSRAKRAMGNK